MTKSFGSLSAGLVVAVLVATWGGIPQATAQQGGTGPELSTSDRIAMLYAPQLNFTRDGDPLIRVGLLEGREEVEFTPSEPIRLMPQGPQGPEVELPGDVTYTITHDDGEAGEYDHWVTVDRLSMDQRHRVDDVVAEWEERGWEPRTFEVGGHFAVHGEVFDSRMIVVGVGGFDTRGEAHGLRRELQAEFGIEGHLHSERLSYPSARLEFKGQGLGFTLRHDDVLWISSRSGREEDIRYTIPGIPQSYDQGTETRTYTGELIFTPDQNGRIAVINNLGAERILKGTVPSETFSSAPQGALRAQAIAARNEIFAAIGVRNLADPFMLRADIYDQVYGGVDVEQESTSQAVDATRGQVMLEEDNRIVNAVYSSNAGGFTEHNDNVWDAKPQDHLRGRIDAPDENIPREFRDGIDDDNLEAFLDSDFSAYSRQAPVSSSDFYRWDATATPREVRQWLDERDDDIGPIEDAEVIERGISGRIIRLRLRGQQGETVVERELNVRRLFGGLRSGLFSMDLERDADGVIREFQFRGAGFGHGVGMCQTGAIGMADEGRNHREILNHYYRGIDVHELY